MITAVIIDDEDHARENLHILLSSNHSHVSIVGEADSVDSAVHVIENTKPQLVFLDIELSDGSGFNVLERVNTLDFQVIFVTAFSEFAVLAFRYNALDYLLKPISIDELNEAVSKIQDKVSGGYLTEAELNFLIENMRKKAEDKQLVIRNSDGITYIKVTDIVRCEGDGNYTTLFLAKEKKVVASKPLREYDTILPSTMFFRVHQTHLINLNFIKKFTRNDGAVVLIDNTHIPVARRRKQEFLAKLDSAN